MSFVNCARASTRAGRGCTIAAELSAVLLIAFAATAVLAHGKLESYERDISSVVDGNRLLNVELLKPPGSQRPQRGAAATNKPLNHKDH
jgi:hypothetical protein